MKNCRAIIFDLDGTLYRMRWFMKPVITLLCLPRPLWLPRFLKVRDMLMGLDFGSREKLYEELEKRWSQRFPHAGGKLVSFVERRFYPAFVSVMQLQRNSRPGLKESLARVRLRGIKLGVLSDYGMIPERCKQVGIDISLFDTIVSSEDCGALKPCPRPFVEMAEKWNISPGEVLVIGDRDDTDGAAARGAGMQFLQITDSKIPAYDALRWDDIRKMLIADPTESMAQQACHAW